MAFRSIAYNEARPLMQPGDVIACIGRGFYPLCIRLATLSSISHVGVILQNQITSSVMINQIIESATVRGHAGVNVSRLSDRLDTYQGEMLWLPRRRSLPFNHDAFFEYLFNKEKQRTHYDTFQAVWAGLDFSAHPGDTEDLAPNKEDLGKLFCSELVSSAFEAAGTVPPVNSSEVTPIDLCRWNIYEDDYFLIEDSREDDYNPKDANITRYNSINPAAWSR